MTAQEKRFAQAERGEIPPQLYHRDAYAPDSEDVKAHGPSWLRFYNGPKHKVIIYCSGRAELYSVKRGIETFVGYLGTGGAL